MIIDYTDGTLTMTDDDGVTFLVQPSWPDGTPWADEAEARAWADIVTVWMADPEAPQPPGGPS